MCEAVASALDQDRHLVFAAGTGTGKSMAYLAPLVTSGKKAVVAAATKALQDQLVNKDLPQLARTLGMPLNCAVLKGRSNCICRKKLADLAGVDVPGRSLSLVVVDRIPFPRPDEPLMSARRERYGPGAFHQIDVPRAATTLAQGIGRLIRSANDRGVVAVLDSRLATDRYRQDLLRGLPPFRRTIDLVEVEAFLADIRRSAERPARD